MIEDYETASLGKRYLTGLFDLVLIFLFTLLTYLVIGFSIGKQLCDFDGQILYQKQLALDIYDHMYETHLFIKGEDDEPLIAKEIYDVYVDSLIKNDELDENGQYTNILAYYYITYDKSMTPKSFNEQILKINDSDSLFQYRNGDDTLIGTLKNENYSLLKQYREGVVNTETDDINNKVATHFQKVWYKAVENEKKSTFMVTIVNDFNQSIYIQGLAIGMPAIVLFVLFSLIFTAVVPLFMKGKTFGNKITRTKNLTLSNKQPGFIRIIIRFIIQTVLGLYIPFLCIALITGLENACKVPLLKAFSKTIPLATVSFTLIIVALINLFILSLNKHHQSYAELLTNTYCADLINLEKEKEENGKC